MADYSDVRCLFCSTGKEETVVRCIQEKSKCRALFPQRVKNILQEHKWIETFAPLLPGYVFVYSSGDNLSDDELLDIRYVIRILSYCDSKNLLVGKDREFADWVWQLNGVIQPLKAAQIGDRIEIIDGVFKKLKGNIVRMDKRRKTICVSIDGDSAIKRIWLTYDVVRKLDAE